MTTLAVVVAAYLLGSLPFAVIVSRLFGLSDPRSYGSKNPGATNVLRSGNKLAAALTLLGDALKGWLAVWLARRYGAQFGIGDFAIALAGLAAFLGHLFPLFLGFKGGKGVATAFGVLAGFDGWIGLGLLGVWFATAALFRYSSLAAIAAAVAAPAGFLALRGSDEYFMATLPMTALLLWRHRGNIRRLLTGEESRLGAKKPAQTSAAGSERV
jgi:acyl phosphate:glycerol-3-phosphate acyltransferase